MRFEVAFVAAIAPTCVSFKCNTQVCVIPSANSRYEQLPLQCCMRVFLITGASSGIGAAAARALATPETAIAVHARKNRAGAERVAQAATAAGAQTLVVEGDLVQPGT